MHNSYVCIYIYNIFVCLIGVIGPKLFPYLSEYFLFIYLYSYTCTFIYLLLQKRRPQWVNNAAFLYTFVQQYKVCSLGTLLHRDFLLDHLSLSLISLPISPLPLPLPLLLPSLSITTPQWSKNANGNKYSMFTFANILFNKIMHKFQ